MDSPSKISAYAWLREEDWPSWLSIDQKFEPTYGSWLAKSEAAIRQLEAIGLRVERVIIAFDEFVKWNRSTGGDVDSRALAAFAAYNLVRRRTAH